MTNNINILDCTLRDGGYANNWDFPNKQIKNIITAIDASKIDIIECGYLNDINGKSSNSTLFSTVKTINNILQDLNIMAKKVVMINLREFDLRNLIPQNESSIDGIRLAFHKEDLNLAVTISKQIIKLGYQLYFQPMVTKNYNDIEFLSLIEKANNLDIYSFYIVDSFGSMTLNEFQRYMIQAHNNLNTDVVLGYHSHNNMQLAFSNAINMCNTNLHRDIIIDSSIYGIGRGAGNLNTELIADYLNNEFNHHYEILPLLETIDSFLSSLMKQKPWGFSPAQYLSASFNCHPNYATYLINKNTNHVVNIQRILSSLPQHKKSSFDLSFIENLYTNFIIKSKTGVKDTFTLLASEKVLLIASGKSVNQNIDIINSKIQDNRYIVISLNHIPKIDTDYYFFTNQKRFDEFSSKIDLSKTIITNNIVSTYDIQMILDFQSLAFTNNTLVTNVAIIALNQLISFGIKEVEIAGLDGYQINLDNYNYNESTFITDHQTLLEENNLIKLAINHLQNKIKINFITPSLFRNILKPKILGVIPARYKSSRFPGKPLSMIKNIPMIKRTYTQAKKSKLLDNLLVATDSPQIEQYCQEENIPVVMTSENCLTGTDRIAEVSITEHYDLYVNIQGDEPIIDPESIDEVVQEFKNHGNNYIAYNLYKEIKDEKEISSDTIIKVIVNEKDELMYMSRLAVPFNKSTHTTKYIKQICVYGFTKEALEVFSSKTKTKNEQFEDIEILRFLDMGYKVKMRKTEVSSIAVDIPDDIQKVEKFLYQNGLE